MKKRWRKGLGVLLALTVLWGCRVVAAAYNGGVIASGYTLLSGQVTDNVSDNIYTLYHANIVNSYLAETSDGNLVRVEYTGSNVLIETYSSAGSLLSTQTLDCPLPIFGGFYAGSDAYYLVFAQQNTNESNGVEVMRVVKYSHNWTYMGETNLYGINTTVPFRAGSLRMTETGGKLYIHTCHEMYTVDGLNHQANMTLVIDEATMTLSDSCYDARLTPSYGYVSHSLDQHIQTDGTYIYRVDLGDYSTTRGIVITRSNVNSSITSVGSNYTVAFDIHAETTAHYNYTGVSVGGFELSGNNCLIVGNSVIQDGATYDVFGQRNIFLTVTNKNLGSNDTKTIWLTNYTDEDGITPRVPQLVKLGDNSFLIMWEEYNSATREVRTNMVTVDGDGNLTSNRIEVEMRLSDCQPIVTNSGLVTWYVSNGSRVVLYVVNPSSQSLDAINIRDFGNGPHTSGEPQIVGEVAATCATEGRYTVVTYCTVCGNEASRKTVAVPTTSHNYSDEWFGNDTNHWHACTACEGQSDIDEHTFLWVTDQAATEHEADNQYKECTVCGYVVATEAIPAADTSGEDGDNVDTETGISDSGDSGDSGNSSDNSDSASTRARTSDDTTIGSDTNTNADTSTVDDTSSSGDTTSGGDTTTSTDGSSGSPQTGDSAPVMGLFILAVSATAITFITAPQFWMRAIKSTIDKHK